ncbi:MAG: Unknown protein [uncultured Sulfurovum sp.]|uniref:Uncharacterized protein n=1 Tax=uncultured Sulfurovum sp. TaxID=269237 RepID=A0A6S6TID1_9BACT|nr:MAG: Unknown protein [uncultured Sulfurovum sp.]
MAKRTISLIYLILGTVGFIGYVSIFNHWLPEIIVFAVLGVIFYVISLFLLIFLHPVICLYYWRRRVLTKAYTQTVKTHFIWSILMAILFWVMIFNGYIITV